MQLFECSIYTFSQEIFNRRVQSISFTTLHEGELTILHGHEDAMFFLQPGKINMQMRDVHSKEKDEHNKEQHAYDIYAKNDVTQTHRSFYNGVGYAKIEHGKVSIFAFPILAHGALNKEMEEKIAAFGEYGYKCLSGWHFKGQKAEKAEKKDA